MIAVEGLNKFFGPTQVLREVGFQADKGELLGFLGLNGAGKTTTMRILTGYYPASSGRATVAGYDIATQSLQARRQIGYMPESVPLYSDMVVSGYLRFVAEIKGVPRGRIKAQLADLSDRIGLGTVENRIIGKLSKGYRQRVGLAQSLIGEPSVLILDEPTEGLDPAQRREIRQLIRDMAGERTVILCTHILPEVSMTCQRVLIIHRGRIVADRQLADLDCGDAAMSHIHLRIAGDVARCRSVLGTIEGITEVQATGQGTGWQALTVTVAPGADPRAAIARQVVGADLGLLELVPVRPTLEDMFVQLTSGEAEPRQTEVTACAP